MSIDFSETPEWVLISRKKTLQQANTRKRRAGLRTMIDGRLTAPLPPDRHGSLSTYNNWVCRCLRCQEAMRTYQVEYKKRNR